MALDRFVYEVAETLCNECQRISRKKFPSSIGCAFRCLDNEFCDDVLLKSNVFCSLCRNDDSDHWKSEY